MKNYCSLFTILIALVSSCSSPSSKGPVQQESSSEYSNIDTLPSGKWIVVSELRYFEKNDKVIEEGKLELIPADEAFVYDFKSKELVTVTNLNKDFAWDFNLVNTHSHLSLRNINGDAEDDDFIYLPMADDKIVLHRKVKDADPDDDNGFIVANFVTTLKRVL